MEIKKQSAYRCVRVELVSGFIFHTVLLLWIIHFQPDMAEI